MYGRKSAPFILIQAFLTTPHRCGRYRAPVTPSSPPPRPAALTHLRPSDAIGMKVVLAATVVTAAGLTASTAGDWTMWALGQLLLAGAMVHWFVLLHECGHGTLFHSRRANAIAGHLAGVMSGIPFAAWSHVHRRHHRWTGWQDLDPTTAALTPRSRSHVVTMLVRTCWACWIPVFALTYRLTNFWHPRRLLGSADRSSARRMAAGAIALLAVYALVTSQLGLSVALLVFVPARLLALVVEEMLILSQHTHVPMDVSHGGRVSPHPAIDQETFTRSLRLPRGVSAWLLHVDAHELHHMYPFVPGYRLREIPYSPTNEVPWWRWCRDARSMPGDVLLFQNRRQTGIDL